MLLNSIGKSNVYSVTKFKQRLRAAYPSRLMPPQSHTETPCCLISAHSLQLSPPPSPPHVPKRRQTLKGNEVLDARVWDPSVTSFIMSETLSLSSSLLSFSFYLSISVSRPISLFLFSFWPGSSSSLID